MGCKNDCRCRFGGGILIVGFITSRRRDKWKWFDGGEKTRRAAPNGTGDEVFSLFDSSERSLQRDRIPRMFSLFVGSCLFPCPSE